MRGLMALLALGLAACGEEQAGDGDATPILTAPSGPQSSVAGTPAPTKASLLAVPDDQAELQRMIDLGYTVHDEHLHPPGAKECPLMGGDMVQ